MLPGKKKGQPRAPPASKEMTMSANGADADDLLLARAAARGDEAAFARLYERHAGRVAKRLSHLLGPAGGVDDLVQETFVRAMKSLPQFRGDCSFRHWLLRIAMSLARDEQRRARRSIWKLFTEPEEIEQTLAADVADADRYADLVAVHRALAKLSPRLREVVVLFELEGESLAEIAAQFEVPVNTVASRLRRGRERLRGLLHRSGYADELSPAPMVPNRGRS
jgi:RNA polymerase sigma-70 factor (ECF subfamily)